MKNYYYLVHIQYLGFRYHGWQKQPELKTVASMIEKTLTYVLGYTDFKILGASRTDSKVSANHSAFELFVKEPVDTGAFLKTFNKNLPNDIKAVKIEEKDKRFNIIHAPRIKAYIYLFSFKEKNHPFCASLISSFQQDLDLDLMKTGALLFKGRHNFKQYCTKPNPGTHFEREIMVSKITENNIFKANFFPKKSYAYHIHSRGFLRYQVRLIMGQLLRLGRHEISLDDIKASLLGYDNQPLRNIAPASGLILNKIEFAG